MKYLRLVEQFWASRLVIGLIMIVSSIAVGLVLVVHFWKDVPFGNLTRDPVAILDAPIYTGFLSQLGIFLWSASATVCMFGAAVLSREAVNLNSRRFLAVSGVLTLVLGLDDALLLHEGFFPYFGIPEQVAYAGYAGFTLYYLVRFRADILATEHVLLWMALSLFGLSVASDLVSGPFLFEDGVKLAGIVSWLAYFFRTAASAVRRNVA